MANFMVLGSSIGMTTVFTRGSLWRGRSMAMECGEREILMRNMKESLCKIERKATEYTLGITETYIKGIIRPI